MKKVLLVRLSAIGDIVFASTLLGSLKAEKNYVVWLVKAQYSSLLEGNYLIDEVIPLPVDEWKELLKGKRFIKLIMSFFSFLSRFRENRYDLAIDLHGLMKGAIWVFLSKAKYKVGLGKREGNWLFLDKVIERGGHSEQFASEYLYLIDQMKWASSDGRPKIVLCEQAISNAKTLLGSFNIKKYIVIAPFTTRPQKHWLDDYWCSFIKSFLEKYHEYKLLILGGKGNIEKATKYFRDERVVCLVGITDLGTSAALIMLSDGIVGVDTGLTHLGTAFGINTVAIFGSTCPYLRTYSNKTIVLYEKLPCSPCRRKPTCDGRYDCMKIITPEMLLDKVSFLLDG
ncbi:MAG: glycosyltransferase family 9 protein [Calditerrivibrio sp.]|nr:glycosyltransferase family 9 protein [Calditerrivibrio sp.]